MKMTLVRIIENKQPVMAVDRIDDLVSLGATVDTITDPSLCEYLDIDIEMPIQIFYPDNMDWDVLDDDEKCDALCNAKLGADTAIKIEAAFKRNHGWIAFPDNFDFLSVSRDSRIMQPENLF